MIDCPRTGALPVNKPNVFISPYSLSGVMPTRDVHKARQAYRLQDVEGMVKAHSQKPHKHIEHHTKEGKYLKSVVYGGLDGIITTFAIVAGVTGAALTSSIVLILGFANLLADGISMAVGDYLSTKSAQEYRKEERKELEEITKSPSQEVEESVEISPISVAWRCRTSSPKFASALDASTVSK